MNQILQTKKNNKSFSIYYNIIFFISIILIFSLAIYLFFTSLTLKKNENYSKQILENYNITRLYSNNEKISYSKKSLDNDEISIIGIIEIPKLSIQYPIFSNYEENLLKISPCRFFGPFPGKKGNLCIAGHNYDNNKFFSKINTLNIGDDIIIYNNNQKRFTYTISKIYEVKENDLSPIYNYNKDIKQLTLFTCNNLNKNRIIVKASIF